jgi:uncharacterized protein
MSPGRSSFTADVVDAKLLAARESSLDRAFQVQELDRLTEWSAGETAHLSIRFYMADHRVGIAGRATAKMKLTCQRCLGAMTALVDDEFHVVIVDSEAEMAQLPEQQEAVIADASRLDLAWLIEEQLLLAMPLVPVHDAVTECTPASIADTQAKLAARTGASVGTEESQRPFANLRQLMQADGKQSS